MAVVVKSVPPSRICRILVVITGTFGDISAVNTLKTDRQTEKRKKWGGSERLYVWVGEKEIIYPVLKVRRSGRGNAYEGN
jgi:hypothetical protein